MSNAEVIFEKLARSNIPSVPNAGLVAIACGVCDASMGANWTATTVGASSSTHQPPTHSPTHPLGQAMVDRSSLVRRYVTGSASGVAASDDEEVTNEVIKLLRGGDTRFIFAQV